MNDNRREEQPTMRTRREMLISTITGLGVAALGIPWLRANEWRSQFSTLNFGVVSSENEADRIARYKAFVAYLERRLQVPIKMHQPQIMPVPSKPSKLVSWSWRVSVPPPMHRRG